MLHGEACMVKQIQNLMTVFFQHVAGKATRVLRLWDFSVLYLRALHCEWRHKEAGMGRINRFGHLGAISANNKESR